MSYKYKIVKSFKLTEVINSECIVSVVEVTSINSKKSLAIAVKEDYNLCGEFSYLIHSYGGPGNLTVYIPLSKYTYHIPDNVGLPRELWSNVIVSIKEAMHDKYKAKTFCKASITKKVV